MGFALSHANSRNQPASTSSRAPWFVLPLLLAAILGLEVAVWSDAKPSTATLTLEGQVVKLAELLKADDVQVDADAVPFVLALRTQDGKLLPIVKTLGSRALFQDGRLLNRPLQVRGRLAAGGSVLVIDRFLHSEKRRTSRSVLLVRNLCHSPGLSRKRRMRMLRRPNGVAGGAFAPLTDEGGRSRRSYRACWGCGKCR
jgi:hypothetical protein